MRRAGTVQFVPIGIFAIGSLALVSMLAGCGAGEPISADDSVNAPAQASSVAPASPVDVADADPRSGRESAALVARIESPSETLPPLIIDTHLVVEEDVLIPSRMSGIVEQIFVDRGSRVSRGQLLLRLRNHDLRLRVKRAEIALRRSEADFDRAARLHEERTISESEYEAAQLDHEGISVDLEIAREELEKSLVRAPFDGLIIERFAKIGQKVIEDENPPLFRLSALGPLQARLYLPERVARSLHQGDAVEIVPRFGPAKRVRASLSWISPVVDASSGTSLAIIDVPAVEDGSTAPLLPGAAVSVNLNVPVDEAQ